MAETRYLTLNHEPPNGGVPPGTTFAQATSPQGNPPMDNGPPDGGNPNTSVTPGPPPPPYNAPMLNYPIPAYTVGPVPFSISPFPVPMPTTAPAPAPTPAPTPATFQGFTGPVYEPPGQYVDGELLRAKDWSYISHAEHTTIYFVNSGVRPCDSPNGYYPNEFGFLKHRVPCNLTVRELIRRLGCPEGATRGVTEMFSTGNDRFRAGESFTQGGEMSRHTLAEVGWTAQRGNDNPVWLIVQR